LELRLPNYCGQKLWEQRTRWLTEYSLIASLDELGAELGRSGNTINQLVKYANTLNKIGKVDEAVMNRFNVLFSD